MKGKPGRKRLCTREEALKARKVVLKDPRSITQMEKDLKLPDGYLRHLVAMDKHYTARAVKAVLGE